MRMIIIGAAATMLLAGCSDDSATAPKPEEAAAAALTPGEYEISATVAALRSTDKTTPASKAKVGDPAKVTRICVPADGTIDPAAFAEGSETCNPMDNYMRNGRMSLQYKCTRVGSGQLTHMADGNFKTDSFEAKVTTATYFSGPGDYELTRSFNGKRVGDCPAAPAKP